MQEDLEFNRRLCSSVIFSVSRFVRSIACEIIKRPPKLGRIFGGKVFVDYFRGDLFTSGESGRINCHYIVINRMTLVGPTRYCNSFYMKNS